MTNSETKNFSQNVSSSYHLEDRGKCNKNTCANARNVPKLRFKGYNDEWKKVRTEEIFENNNRMVLLLKHHDYMQAHLYV